MRHSKLAPFAARVASHDSVLGGHKVPKNVSSYDISLTVLLILLIILMSRCVNLIYYPGIIITIFYDMCIERRNLHHVDVAMVADSTLLIFIYKQQYSLWCSIFPFYCSVAQT